jgi:hypothetical protein
MPSLSSKTILLFQMLISSSPGLYIDTFKTSLTEAEGIIILIQPPGIATDPKSYRYSDLFLHKGY